MPRNKVNLHHDAGGHDHAHEHAAHHAHSHDGAAPLSEEQTLALMTYMLDHNRSHADELHNIATPSPTRAGARPPRWSATPSTTSATATRSWQRPSRC